MSNVIRLHDLLFGVECWLVKNLQVEKTNVVGMRMLRWMCEHTRRDKIRKEDVRGKVETQTTL